MESSVQIQGELTQVRMGLGQAVLRLIHVENLYQQGISVGDDLVRERNLIVEALDQFELDLGFDCDGDGKADVSSDVTIFKASAETSCCRILPRDYQTRATKTGSKAGAPRKLKRTKPKLGS